MLFLHYAVFLRKQKTHKRRTKCILNFNLLLINSRRKWETKRYHWILCKPTRISNFTSYLIQKYVHILWKVFFQQTIAWQKNTYDISITKVKTKSLFLEYILQRKKFLWWVFHYKFTVECTLFETKNDRSLFPIHRLLHSHFLLNWLEEQIIKKRILTVNQDVKDTKN